MSSNALARLQSRRTLLTAALAGTAAGSVALGGQVAPAAPPQPDPIFAAIEKARTSYAAYSEAIAAEDRAITNPDVSDVACDEARRFVCVADDEWRDASDALYGTPPATPAGLVAMLEAWWVESETDYGLREPDLEGDRDKRTLRNLIDSAQTFGTSLS
ncbi:hypothetical protein [uncultured Enterovirga sp.]|uniref:hypothetical protein n=1 Tax=uncultured Enterovirga sp. TaxID=2026352 RepID=UPI0035CAA0ED